MSERLPKFSPSRRGFLVAALSAGYLAACREGKFLATPEDLHKTPDAIYIGEVIFLKEGPIQVKRYGHAKRTKDSHPLGNLEGSIVINDVPWQSLESIEGIPIDAALGFTIKNPLIDTYSDTEGKLPTPHLRVEAKVKNERGEIKKETLYFDIGQQQQKSGHVEIKPGDLRPFHKVEAGYEIDTKDGKKIIPFDEVGIVNILP